MAGNRIQPRDVNSYQGLKDLAQSLCDEANNVDGILIVRLNNQIPDVLEVCTENNFQGIDLKALSGRVAEVIQFSENIVFSHGEFIAGEPKSILYEFENLAFVVYSLKEESLSGMYLVLVNTMDSDLGAFNFNRGRVRAQMVVAIKRVSQMGQLNN